MPSADPLDPPFGAHALPALREVLRRAADLAPRRWIVSLLRRLAIAGLPGPFDVELFGGQRVRLHPRDNRTEKRALAGARFWDAEERAWLAGALETPGDGRFVFVDAGANAGLYTLSLRAEARRRGVALAALAVEPDPVNAGRLRDNLAASGAGEEVVVLAEALGAEAGEARFLSAGLANRGEARLAGEAAGDAVRVPVRPLLEAVRAAGLERIDALKIDLEGHEPEVMRAFLAQAPRALLPRFCVMETGRGEAGGALIGLMERAGYRLASRTRLNALLTLDEDDAGTDRRPPAGD
ncbi:MAG: FkbM family methyltransferase [Pseudomonadota bacterium]